VNRRSLRLSSGKFTKIADGSCVASVGDTHVLVAAVSKNRSGYGSFVPLTVDYREKAAAGGRIPTNHLRRELAPSEREILTGRLIDRSIRTSFTAGYFGDTQITCNLLSVDSVHEPDVVAINAASAALAMSDIPWFGPVAAVRVSLIDNQVVVNPTRREMSKSACNLVVTSRPNRNVLMMEGSCNQPVTLNDLLKLIKKAQKENQSIIREIESLIKHHGKPKRKIEKVYLPTDEQILDAKL
jgi:polyribonucleotide nucleotidyltransferase